ncbi:MAG: epoxyqueuosine reductase QueH [Desulfovibrio sp.]|nr:epoxyqueuosine reductase QueH [Desulfovibrio sp.]
MSAGKLLLHVCCGPCSIMTVKRLRDDGYDVTAWYMNPNIQPLAEYLRRREAAGECAERLGIPILYDDETWDIAAWLRGVRGRDEPPARCRWCCAGRVRAAFDKALALGFEAVSTSLLYSRYQPHDFIAETGRRCAEEKGLAFVYRDFREYWQDGIDISKEWGIYRQPYCGCVYSEAERYAKKLRRLIRDGRPADPRTEGSSAGDGDGR